MRQKTKNSTKQILTLITAIVVLAGVLLSAVTSVAASNGNMGTSISSDAVSSNTPGSAFALPTQLSNVNYIINMSIAQHENFAKGSFDRASLMKSARSQLVLIDNYALEHNLSLKDFAVGTIMNTTSNTIKVYLTGTYNSNGNSYKREISVNGAVSSQTVNFKLSKLQNMKFSSSCQTGNWDGYVFNNPHPWYYFGGSYPINWISEGITAASVQSPPSSQVAGNGVKISLSGWDSLASDSSGCTMVQSGWVSQPGYSHPQLWYEFLYPSATQGAIPFPGQANHPINFGDYMYIYINENSTSQYYVLISDITNGIDYGITVSTSADAFTPYYFGSIIEAPDCSGTIAQIPEFSSFQVNVLSFYSNGNTLLYGSTEYSAGNYAYFYLQQSSNGQNMNNQFSSSVDGSYTVSWVNSYYSISYMQSSCGVS